MTVAELRQTIKDVEKNMKEAAKQLDFEHAAELRDVLFELRASERLK
jgi:excinuclease ABC subunit B